LGLIPGWGGTQRAVRLMGASRASLLVLTGRRVGAEEALRIGLVDLVVSRHEFEAECRRLAEEISSGSPAAVAAAKKAIVEGGRAALKEGLRIEREAWSEAFSTPERVEGLKAFLERRAPRWTEG